MAVSVDPASSAQYSAGSGLIDTLSVGAKVTRTVSQLNNVTHSVSTWPHASTSIKGGGFTGAVTLITSQLDKQSKRKLKSPSAPGATVCHSRVDISIPVATSSPKHPELTVMSASTRGAGTDVRLYELRLLPGLQKVILKGPVPVRQTCCPIFV